MNLFNDNELDRWLRQSAGPGNAPPAPDGWDTPPERVWEQLRTDLDDRRKRRRRYFAFWSVLLIGLFAGGWWAGSAAFMPNVSTPSGTGQAPVPDVRQISGNNAPPEQVKTFSTPSSTNSFLKNNSGPVAGEMAYVEPAPNPDNTQEKTPAQVEDGQKITDAVPGNWSDALKPTNQRPARSDDSKPSDRSASVVPGNRSAGLKLSDQSTEPSDDSGSSDGNDAAMPIDRSDDVESSDGSASEVPGNGLADLKSSAQSTARSDDSTSSDRNETTMPIPINWSDGLKSSEQTPAPIIDPFKYRPGLYAGAAIGVFFTTRVLKQAGNTLPNGRETGGWAWQQGLNIGLAFHPNWAIETGLQRTSIRLQAERLLRFRYRVNNEKFDNQRFLYQNSANDVMETAFGAVEMRMDIGREPNRPIDDLAVFRIVLHTDEQVHYWRIPLSLRYRSAATGPWQWSLSAGAGFNFAAGYDLQLTAARTNRPGVRDIRARVLGRASGLAPFMADVQLGGQLGYRLSPRCSLLLTPEFRYGLSPMYRQSSFHSQAVSGGVQVGVVVRL